MKNLHAQSIALTGKHLIEASAGTGKTYNITRIYLRMLLERKLPVEQILVMTFTKDATEEIKGRIDDFIRLVINDWHKLVAADEYFTSLASRISYEQALPLLRRALLFLDEAAIFTIHGFCKRVLSQHAFASGVSFKAQMETDCQDLVLQACQDWYRTLAKTEQDNFLLLSEFWSSPESFLTDFNKAIGRDIALTQLSVDDIIASFIQLVITAKQQLIANQEELTAALISPKKPAEQATRQQEFNQLIAWLEAACQADIYRESNHAFSAMPSAFIDGRRFGRAKEKPRLVEIFTPVNEVKIQAAKLSKSLAKARAFAVVNRGIIAIREMVIDKKQQLGVLSFDDLIATLANKLTAEQASNHLDNYDANLTENIVPHRLAARLFEQYPVALVDEFQDTDPLQFDILRAIYTRERTQGALFMIGDPKQAIYGFRGGDVFAYLAARNDCQYQWLMDTNWRSSPLVVAGYNRLFYGTALSGSGCDVFGYDISYQPVKASPVAKLRKFDVSPEQVASAFTSSASTLSANAVKTSSTKALQFVHFQGEDDSKAAPQSFRSVMANWCAHEITQLLSETNAQFPERLQAQDIAILVRDGAEAASIKLALAEHNIAAVFLSDRANLYLSEQASQLLLVLKAILFIENDKLFLAGITTEILGYSPHKLYQLQNDDLAWQQLKVSFFQLREHWQYKGFISMALKLMHEYFVIDVPDTRQKGGNNKDRTLTNLLHLFELLQTASQRHHQPQALLFWFEQQISSDSPASEAELRLESDANLIRIVTQHGCKGLEYPVVFVPFASRYKSPLKFGNRSVNLIEYHDENKALIISLDGSAEAKAAMADEAYAESIRLLYVAITRAEQRCYLLTTNFENYHLSPLGKTLNWQKQQDIVQSIQTLMTDCSDAIGLEQVNYDFVSEQTQLAQASIVTPELPTFINKIERDWWLSSFSALTRNIRHDGISAPDRDQALIERNGQALTPVLDLSHLLRFRLTKGARTGNLLHDILEHCDFLSPDWPLAMKQPLKDFGQIDLDSNELVTWLSQVLHTPLTSVPACDEQEQTLRPFCLADLTWQQTLRESEFYFPMNSATTFALSQLLAKHRQVSSKSIHLPVFKKLKGMMHGFIDLIFENEGKYYLADYKSSHLGDDYSCYSPLSMKNNMEGNYYDLQYLIYALALHRQLKYSIRNYNVEQHFGGVYYFYLRGMSDSPEHQQCGVYQRNITEQELMELDHLFSENQLLEKELN